MKEWTLEITSSRHKWINQGTYRNGTPLASKVFINTALKIESPEVPNEILNLKDGDIFQIPGLLRWKSPPGTRQRSTRASANMTWRASNQWVPPFQKISAPNFALKNSLASHQRVGDFRALALLLLGGVIARNSLSLFIAKAQCQFLLVCWALSRGTLVWISYTHSSLHNIRP